MSRFHPYKSATSLLVACGLMAGATAPILTPSSAVAQLFPQQRPRNGSSYNYGRVTIPYGTRIPVRYDEAEKIVVSPDETVPLTLKVAANVRSRDGRILIPSNSEVIGKLQPTEGGSQFVAREIVIYGDRLPIDATSQVITEREEIREGTNVGSILKGAAIGAGAAAVISLITGNRSIELGEVLAGGGLGALGGWVFGRRKQAEVVVINPDEDLDLTLQSDLALR
jgi:hypothetical protein